MIRKVYRAQLKEGTEEQALDSIRGCSPKFQNFINNEEIMTVSVYRWGRNIFLYYECISREIFPTEIFGECESHLVDWPGSAEMRKWIPMVDVFHFNEPTDAEHWSRKVPVERRIGKVAYLKPEMMASYIYYHYQLQEERAFLGDKYEIISIHENLLFCYFERPEIVEEPIVSKKLNTNGTPKNWSDARMDLHFIPWGDGTIFFKEIEEILSYYYIPLRIL